MYIYIYIHIHVWMMSGRCCIHAYMYALGVGRGGGERRAAQKG